MDVWARVVADMESADELLNVLEDHRLLCSSIRLELGYIVRFELLKAWTNIPEEDAGLLEPAAIRRIVDAVVVARK